MFINLHMYVASESQIRNLQIGKIELPVQPKIEPLPPHKQHCYQCSSKDVEIQDLKNQLREERRVVQQLRQILGRYPQV